MRCVVADVESGPQWLYNDIEMWRLALAGALIWTLVGCVNVKSTEDGTIWKVTTEQEVAFGRAVHAEVTSRYSILRNEKVTKAVNDIGRRLAEKSGRAELPFTFTVLNSPEVNAFAGPGGFVYVTTGLLKFIKSKDELASVLGHEIGHIVCRHTIRAFQRAVIASRGLGVVDFATRIVGIPAARLGGAAAQFFAMAAFQGYSRDLERQADYVGVRLSYRAGFRPEAGIDLFERLLKENEKEKKSGFLSVFFRSHPTTKERIENLRSYIQEIKEEENYEKKRRSTG